MSVTRFERHAQQPLGGIAVAPRGHRSVWLAIATTAPSRYAIHMRTTITLDDDVFQAVQGLAKASGKSLGEVMSDLVRRALKGEHRGLARTGGLPVFSTAPDAELIPASRAAELLADDMNS